MENKFNEKEIALFDEIMKLYKTDPNLALALLEDEEQEQRFFEYQKTKIDYAKIMRNCLEELEGDSHEK